MEVIQAAGNPVNLLVQSLVNLVRSWLQSYRNILDVLSVFSSLSTSFNVKSFVNVAPLIQRGFLSFIGLSSTFSIIFDNYARYNDEM